MIFCKDAHDFGTSIHRRRNSRRTVGEQYSYSIGREKGSKVGAIGEQKE